MPTQANSQEINKSRKESRSIVTAPVSAEEVCFPLAEQAALLLRQTEGRKDELVALIEQLFEILQFGPFHKPYLDLI